MTNESANSGRLAAVDRTTFQAELDKLRAREKAHAREGDAIAAAGRTPGRPCQSGRPDARGSCRRSPDKAQARGSLACGWVLRSS